MKLARYSSRLGRRARRRARFGLSQADLTQVAWWVIGNSGGAAMGTAGLRCRVLGYTDAQVSADYAGEPYVTLNFPGDLGHGIGVTATRLIVAPAWDVNANDFQQLYTIPLTEPVAHHQVFGINDVTRVALDIYHPTRAGGEPKVVGFPSQDGAHWLTGGVGIPFDYFNASALEDGVVTSQALMPQPGGSGADSGAAWDFDYDASHNLWWANMIESAADGQGGVRMVSRARYEAGELNLQTFQKIFTGSNFTAADGIAFDAVGGFHLSQWGPVRIAYFDAAVVAAGSGTPSNPAPTRSMTWPGPLDDSSHIVRTAEGDLVQSDWTNGQLRRFTAAQLAAGGLQVPTVTVSTPAGFNPWVVRLRSDLAFHIR